MSIRVRFIVIIGILSLVASVLLAYASYRFSLKNAMADAKKQGAIVFNMIHSSRMYFKKNQRFLIYSIRPIRQMLMRRNLLHSLILTER